MSRRIGFVEIKEDDIDFILGESLSKKIPEFVELDTIFVNAFRKHPKGIEKTEAWLYYNALNTNTDSSLEALIYFYCKGEYLVESDQIKEMFRLRMCRLIERDGLYNKGKKAVIERAKKDEILLSEASELLTFNDRKPRLLYFNDNEEDFIDVTFFRTVEWLNLKGFDPWIESFARDISTFYQGGVDSIDSSFYLFSICRSDLALRKSTRIGLEALLYGVTVGTIDVNRPWRINWPIMTPAGKEMLTTDYIITACVIVFAWARICPPNLNQEIFKRAIVFLNQTQLKSGAWPLTSNDIEGDIIATCYAIFSFSEAKPEKWNESILKAKEWLIQQQNEVGCWDIEGAPTLYINTICLEAINLAENKRNITFTQTLHPFLLTTPQHFKVPQFDKDTILFCEGDPSGKKNSQFDAKCYKKIFSQEFPNVIFYSLGSCDDIIRDQKETIQAISTILPTHRIIRLVDRDDRSIDEVTALVESGIRVLKLRHLESYLLDDEIIEKLCIDSGKNEKLNDIIAIKKDSINSSVARGNTVDDIKSASGEIFTRTKLALSLTQCGNDTRAFLRDTMAPLVTSDTTIYKQLRYDLFEIQ